MVFAKAAVSNISVDGSSNLSLALRPLVLPRASKVMFLLRKSTDRYSTSRSLRDSGLRAHRNVLSPRNIKARQEFGPNRRLPVLEVPSIRR